MNTQEILTTQTNEEVREEQYVVDCETADNEVVEATETTREDTVEESEAVEENKEAADDNLEEKIEAAVERKINEKLTTFEEKVEEDDDTSFDKNGIPSMNDSENHLIEICTCATYSFMDPNKKIFDICPDFEEKLKKNIRIAFLSFDNKERKKAIRFIEALEELNIIKPGHAACIRKETKPSKDIKKQFKEATEKSNKVVVSGPVITCGINDSMMTMSEDEARKAIREQLEKQIPKELEDVLNIESMIEQAMVVWRNSKEKHKAKSE